MDDLASTRSHANLTDTSLVAAVRRQQDDGDVPIVLFSDIDRTYVIQHGTQVELDEHRRNTRSLTAYLAQHHIPVVAVTSRDVGSLRADYQAGELPLFDIALTSLGSERFLLQGDTYEYDVGYARHIDPKNNWRKRAYPVCLRFQEAAAARIEKGLLPADLELYFQPRDRKRPVGAPQPYKISLNYFGSHDVTEILEDLFEGIVDASGLEHLYVVFSFDGIVDGRKRHNIDVLPIRKDIAAHALIRELGAIIPGVKAIYAGDSRNDEDALQRVGDGGIVVGGYRRDIDVASLKGSRVADELFRQSADNHRLIFIEPDKHRRGPASVLAGVEIFRKIWNDPR